MLIHDVAVRHGRRFASKTAAAAAASTLAPKAGPETSLKRMADRMPAPSAIISPVVPRKTDFPPVQGQMQVGSVYRPSGWLKTYFHTFGAPTSIHKTSELLKDESHTAYMWRNATQLLLERISCVEKLERLVLMGPVGVGKTTTMLQLADYLVQGRGNTDKIDTVVYFPRVARWSAGYYPYSPSPLDSSMYDQPDLAIEIMKQIANTNSHLPLAELIAQAEADPLQALDILKNRFLGQIQSSSSGRLFMFVDEINALYAPTGYFDVTSKELPVEKLSVLAAVRDFIENSKSVLVAAESNAPNFSKFMLPVEAFSGEPVRLDYFSTLEVQGLLNYYHQIGQVNMGINSAYAEKIRFVSGGAAHRILSAAHYDSVYQRH